MLARALGDTYDLGWNSPKSKLHAVLLSAAHKKHRRPSSCVGQLIWGKLELKHNRRRLQSRYLLLSAQATFTCCGRYRIPELMTRRPSAALVVPHSFSAAEAPWTGSVEAFPSIMERERAEVQLRAGRQTEPQSPTNARRHNLRHPLTCHD